MATARKPLTPVVETRNHTLTNQRSSHSAVLRDSTDVRLACGHWIIDYPMSCRSAPPDACKCGQCAEPHVSTIKLTNAQENCIRDAARGVGLYDTNWRIIPGRSVARKHLRAKGFLSSPMKLTDLAEAWLKARDEVIAYQHKLWKKRMGYK